MAIELLAADFTLSTVYWSMIASFTASLLASVTSACSFVTKTFAFTGSKAS